MKALAILARKRPEIVECEGPDPGPGEMGVAISQVGLCGTNLDVFDGIGLAIGLAIDTSDSVP